MLELTLCGSWARASASGITKRSCAAQHGSSARSLIDSTPVQGKSDRKMIMPCGRAILPDWILCVREVHHHGPCMGPRAEATQRIVENALACNEAAADSDDENWERHVDAMWRAVEDLSSRLKMPEPVTPHRDREWRCNASRKWGGPCSSFVDRRGERCFYHVPRLSARDAVIEISVVEEQLSALRPAGI